MAEKDFTSKKKAGNLEARLICFTTLCFDILPALKDGVLRRKSISDERTRFIFL